VPVCNRINCSTGNYIWGLTQLVYMSTQKKKKKNLVYIYVMIAAGRDSPDLAISRSTIIIHTSKSK
jgi:hypothetical protein